MRAAAYSSIGRMPGGAWSFEGEVLNFSVRAGAAGVSSAATAALWAQWSSRSSRSPTEGGGGAWGNVGRGPFPPLRRPSCPCPSSDGAYERRSNNMAEQARAARGAAASRGGDGERLGTGLPQKMGGARCARLRCRPRATRSSSSDAARPRSILFPSIRNGTSFSWGMAHTPQGSVVYTCELVLTPCGHDYPGREAPGRRERGTSSHESSESSSFFASWNRSRSWASMRKTMASTCGK